MNTISKSFLFGLLLTTILFAGCNRNSVPKDGDTAFAEKSYSLAATLYEDEIKKEPLPFNQATIAYKIGESYNFTNDPKRAERWYAEAMRLGYKPIATLKHGQMLKSLERYDAAIKEFERYAREEPFEKQAAFDEIKSCREAKKWLKERKNIRIINMAKVNSTASEFGPVAAPDGNILFTSDRVDAIGEDTYNWTGEKFSDLYLSVKGDNDEYKSALNFSSVINTGVNEGSAVFTKDFQQIYFTRCFSQGKSTAYCQIYTSKRQTLGGWSEPERVPLLSDTSNIGQPALTLDGKGLIFASDDSLVENFGGKDLYISYLKDGAWSTPQNLGKGINTKGNELFPYISADGQLYYASDGLVGFGGLDIFKAEKSGSQWANPENLRQPINSGYDDFSIIYQKLKPKNANDAVRQQGIFSSNRPGGQGKDDLYQFVLSNENIYVLEGTVVERIHADTTDPNSKVVDFKPVPGAKLSLHQLGNPEKYLNSTESIKYGKFEFDLEKDSRYRVECKKSGYWENSVKVTTVGKRDFKNTVVVVKVTIILEKIYKDVEVKIPNVYYAFDDTVVRERSFIVLDSLTKRLQENPEISIELGSHTDAQGKDDYNETLSQGRASFVVNYLVKSGVARKRLTAIGYGERNIINRCTNGVECPDEEHEENRRTTFKVVEIGSAP